MLKIFLLVLPIFLPEKVMIIMLSAPCATVNYVLASVMDGDTDIASGTIVTSTLLSILSFVAWLHYLSI
jgi:malate permease and related proteins